MRRGCTTVVGLLFFVVGGAFFGAGVFILSTAQPYKDGTLTTGEITAVFTKGGGDTYQAEITYITAAGETITFRDSCSSSREPDVGDEVRVSYRASDPSKARNLDGCSKLLAWILISVGGFVVLAALVSGVMLLCFCIAAKTAAPDTPATSTPLYKHPESEDTLEIGLPATWEPAVRHCNAVHASVQLGFPIHCTSGSTELVHVRGNFSAFGQVVRVSYCRSTNGRCDLV